VYTVSPPDSKTDNRELVGIVESSDDEERPSITEVDGTVARFEMAYEPGPKDRHAFGPPLVQVLPSLLYLAFGLVVVGVVVAAHAGSSNSSLYTWVVEGDRGRPLGSVPLSIIILLSGVATVARAMMRGVIVSGQGIETRTVLPMGIPRVRKYAWAQVDRFVIDDKNKSVVMELWSGEYERLPAVKDADGLARVVEGVAAARKKQVTRLVA
jgi:hypothetical protein